MMTLPCLFIYFHQAKNSLFALVNTIKDIDKDKVMNSVTTVQKLFGKQELLSMNLQSLGNKITTINMSVHTDTIEIVLPVYISSVRLKACGEEPKPVSGMAHEEE